MLLQKLFHICSNLVPYLSWLESLTHNQEVVGSSPTGTTLIIKNARLVYRLGQEIFIL